MWRTRPAPRRSFLDDPTTHVGLLLRGIDAGTSVTMEEALDRASITQALATAGCIAASEEAEELVDAAGGDPGRLEAMVERRCLGEPVAWITGSIVFCGVEVGVAPGVYVPRWHTEALARRAASLLPPGGVAVDLCTGSGSIALVLAASVPTAQVLATELDPTAARCAGGTASRSSRAFSTTGSRAGSSTEST